MRRRTSRGRHPGTGRIASVCVGRESALRDGGSRAGSLACGPAQTPGGGAGSGIAGSGLRTGVKRGFLAACIAAGFLGPVAPATAGSGLRTGVKRGFLAACIAAGLLGPLDHAVAAQDHPGAEPYRRVCQLCHGAGGRGDIAPGLVPLGYDAEYVLAVVREGYSQMPPISTRELSDDEVRQVVGYLDELSGPPAEAPASAAAVASTPPAAAASVASTPPAAAASVASTPPAAAASVASTPPAAAASVASTPPAAAASVASTSSEAGGGQTQAGAASGYDGPRTPEGQPDLSGFWQVLNSAAWDIRPHNAQDGIPAGLGVVEGGDIPYQPWAAEQQQENYANRLTADPVRQCYLPGVPRITYMPFPFRILQTPDHVVVTYEFAHAVRIIYTDGSPHPLPNDFWMGDSRGHWEGDTLVVDTTHFNGRTWLDAAGNFHSEALHVVERYTPTTPYHIDYEVTLEDPNVFARPWTMRMTLYRRMDEGLQILDYDCVDHLLQMAVEQGEGAR